MVCMIADTVAILYHALYDLRSGFQKMAYHKKRGRSVMLFQSIQNGLRIAVLIAAVKGQINDLLLALSAKIRIVFLQLLGGGVPRGLLSFAAEAQPPVLPFQDL